MPVPYAELNGASIFYTDEGEGARRASCDGDLIACADGLFEQDVNGFKGVVTSRVVWDLFELPKEELGCARVMRTYTAGELVYDRVAAEG